MAPCRTTVRRGFEKVPKTLNNVFFKQEPQENRTLRVLVCKNVRHFVTPFFKRLKLCQQKMTNSPCAAHKGLKYNNENNR
jgi:hypothetical protein